MGRLDGKVSLITGASAGSAGSPPSCSPREGATRGHRRPGRRHRGGRGDPSPPAARPAYVPCDVERRGLGARRGGATPWTPSAGCTCSTTTPACRLADDDGPGEHRPSDVWDTTLKVNVTGLACAASTASRRCSTAGGGSIVNVASFVAHLGAATPQIAYTASKGAVLSMTREIAVIYARQGIRANALCPGPVLTPLLAKYLSDEEKRQRRLVHIPMGRFGEADRDRERRAVPGLRRVVVHDRPVAAGRRRHHRRLHHPRVSRHRSPIEPSIAVTRPRPLTDARRPSVDADEIDTVVVALRRPAGPTHGQARHRPVLPRPRRRHRRRRGRGHRGLQLPAHGRRRHERHRGLPVRHLGGRLRRLPRRGPTCRPCGSRRGSRRRPWCSCDIVDHHGDPVAVSPRQILQHQVAAGRRAGPAR